MQIIIKHLLPTGAMEPIVRVAAPTLVIFSSPTESNSQEGFNTFTLDADRALTAEEQTAIRAAESQVRVQFSFGL